ncbi:MAG TPA: DUF2269 family protein [Gaiellaceae bacterium]
MTNLFFFLHLLGAFCFFAGGAVVGVLQLAAIRQQRPSRVYAFLRLAPYGAALVGAGALLTLVFGIALAHHEELGFSQPWIQAALGLWVAAMVLGAYGGRTARRARHLAEKLAREGDEPSDELRALVSARGPLWASYASFGLLLVIVVLMVWKPGGTPPAVPGWVQAKIAATGAPAYVPTRLPDSYAFSQYTAAPIGGHYRLAFRQPAAGTRELFFTVKKKCPVLPMYHGHPVYDTFIRVGGRVTYTSHTRTAQTAWTCRDGVVIWAWSPVIRHVYDDVTGDELMTLVAYAKRLG